MLSIKILLLTSLDCVLKINKKDSNKIIFINLLKSANLFIKSKKEEKMFERNNKMWQKPIEW